MATQNPKYNDNEIEIREAKKEDMNAVAEMIQELADFEKMPSGPKMSVDASDVKPDIRTAQDARMAWFGHVMRKTKELKRDGFERSPPLFQCKVAALGGGPLVGYALYFPSYSTWEGRALMLEDLYVKRGERRRGVGKRLFNAVAKEASSTGCSRLDFHVLEWNDARDFYENRGAVNLTRQEKWCYYRLAGDALRAAADQPGDQPGDTGAER